MTSFKTIVAAALVALLVSVAAVAKNANVSAPAKLVGKGFFAVSCTMAATEKQCPVRIAARGLRRNPRPWRRPKVRCTGKGCVTGSRPNRNRVSLCGSWRRCRRLGSHFTFRGHAAAYHVLIPAGARGIFTGGSSSARRPRPTAARSARRASAASRTPSGASRGQRAGTCRRGRGAPNAQRARGDARREVGLAEPCFAQRPSPGEPIAVPPFEGDEGGAVSGRVDEPAAAEVDAGVVDLCGLGSGAVGALKDDVTRVEVQHVLDPLGGRHFA